MSKILLDTQSGYLAQGIIQLNEPIQRTIVFLEHPLNLLGFRSSLKTFTKTSPQKEVVTYYEIAYFLELLYTGTIQAFLDLMSTDTSLITRSFEIERLRRQIKQLLSKQLIHNLLDEAKENFDLIQDPEKLHLGVQKKNNKFFVQKLGYNAKSAYICLRDLILAENVLRDEDFNLQKLDTQLLQAVADGKFTLYQIEEGYKFYKENIDSMMETLDMPLVPEYEFFKEALEKIRNIDEAIPR